MEAELATDLLEESGREKAEAASEKVSLAGSGVRVSFSTFSREVRIEEMT